MKSTPNELKLVTRQAVVQNSDTLFVEQWDQLLRMLAESVNTQKIHII